MESQLSSAKPRAPAYRRIADSLRNDISSGKFQPGARLPGTAKLAATLKSSNCTVHHALVLLVREGWLESLNGDGTYVAENANRFVSAGIYHGVDICSNDIPPFLRSIHGSVLKKLAELNKEAHIFVDPRPPGTQQTVLPALAEAVRHRRIQCLIAPMIHEINASALMRLPIPVAFTSHPSSPHFVAFDTPGFVQGSVRHLAAQGCRSVGFLVNVSSDPRADKEGLLPRYRQLLQKACVEENLGTRPAWLRAPSRHIDKIPQYGYREFMEFWRLPDKPEGMIIYPDAAVQGVIAAILEIGLREVTERMKFVFHRNAHIDLLCPIPATWAISDEDRMAEGMIEMLNQQFRGEKATPILIPYVFEETSVGLIAPES